MTMMEMKKEIWSMVETNKLIQSTGTSDGLMVESIGSRVDLYLGIEGQKRLLSDLWKQIVD
jgi:hypothetical protein